MGVKFSHPQKSGNAEKLCKALLDGPLSIEESIAKIGLLGRNRKEHRAVFLRTQDNGWIDLKGDRFHLMPHLTNYIIGLVQEAPAAQQNITPSRYVQPFTPWSGKYNIARPELEERSFITSGQSLHPITRGGGAF